MNKPILWSSTFTAGTLAHLAVAEAEADYDIRFMSLKKGDHKQPEFLAINPKAQVPALQIAPGQVITETPAILTYIARTHPRSGLPPGDAYGEARVLEWLVWGSLQFTAVFQTVSAPSRFTNDPAGEEAVRARGRERAADAFDGANAALLRGDVPLGTAGGVTLAELQFFFLVMGAGFMKFDLTPYPALVAHRARIAERPRAAAALARERAQG